MSEPGFLGLKRLSRFFGVGVLNSRLAHRRPMNRRRAGTTRKKTPPPSPLQKRGSGATRIKSTLRRLWRCVFQKKGAVLSASLKRKK